MSLSLFFAYYFIKTLFFNAPLFFLSHRSQYEVMIRKYLWILIIKKYKWLILPVKSYRFIALFICLQFKFVERLNNIKKFYKKLWVFLCVCISYDRRFKLRRKCLFFPYQPLRRSLSSLPVLVGVLTCSLSIPIEVFIVFSLSLFVDSIVPNPALVGRLSLTKFCYCFFFKPIFNFLIISSTMEQHWKKFDFYHQRYWARALPLPFM